MGLRGRTPNAEVQEFGVRPRNPIPTTQPLFYYAGIRRLLADL